LVGWPTGLKEAVKEKLTMTKDHYDFISTQEGMKGSTAVTKSFNRKEDQKNRKPKKGKTAGGGGVRLQAIHPFKNPEEEEEL